MGRINSRLNDFAFMTGHVQVESGATLDSVDHQGRWALFSVVELFELVP